MEVWKSQNQEGYPIVFEPYNASLQNQDHDLRPQNNRVLKEYCKLKKFESSFIVDAARLWNVVPGEITGAPTLSTAKAAIRLFCKILPV